jgi:hypothetical protein
MKHPILQKFEMICERIYLVGMGLVIVSIFLILVFTWKESEGDRFLTLGLGLGLLMLLEVIKTFLVWIFSGQIPRIGTVVTEITEKL